MHNELSLIHSFALEVHYLTGKDTMKKMLNIFTKPVQANTGIRMNEGVNEPSLYSVRPAARPAPATSASFQSRPNEPVRTSRSEDRHIPVDVPSDYAGIITFFQNVVAEKKSPFTSLVQASERLKDYIPDEISRLKAAYALCREQWQPDALAQAISQHMADIDNACSEAKESTHLHSAERTQQIRSESDLLKRQNAKLRAEIELLKNSLVQLQEKFDSTQDKISLLEEQARLTEKDALCAGFLYQAAENLKNDLQAKKILLGLTI
jgi:hypothetical protein